MDPLKLGFGEKVLIFNMLPAVSVSEWLVWINTFIFSRFMHLVLVQMGLKPTFPAAVLKTVLIELFYKAHIIKIHITWLFRYNSVIIYEH